jgi:hypothetical protein
MSTSTNGACDQWNARPMSLARLVPLALPTLPETVGRGLTPAIFELSKTLPSSYRIVTGGTVEESQKSQASVLAVVSVMLLIMLTVLMFQLQSFQRLVMRTPTISDAPRPPISTRCHLARTPFRHLGPWRNRPDL